MRCPVCAGNAFRAAEPGFVRCRACGLFQQERRRQPAELQAEVERRHTRVDLADAKPIMNCQSCEGEIAFLARNCPDLLRGGRALDVGTALGDFVACLGASGMHASGIEPDRKRAEIGRKFGLDVRDGRFGSADCAGDGESFDLISMRECFCYLDDFHDALATVRRQLTRRGVLYIKMNVADSPYYWTGITPSHRLGLFCTAFFTRKQLLMILQKHGFAVIATERSDFPLAHAEEVWRLPPWIVARAGRLLRLFLRMIPPDRFMVLARPRAD